MTTRTKVVLMVLGTVLALTAAMFASPLLGVIGVDKAFAREIGNPTDENLCIGIIELSCPDIPDGGSPDGGSPDGGSPDGVPNDNANPEGGNEVWCSFKGWISKVGCKGGVDWACGELADGSKLCTVPGDVACDMVGDSVKENCLHPKPAEPPRPHDPIYDNPEDGPSAGVPDANVGSGDEGDGGGPAVESGDQGGGASADGGSDGGGQP